MSLHDRKLKRRLQRAVKRRIRELRLRRPQTSRRSRIDRLWITQPFVLLFLGTAVYWRVRSVDWLWTALAAYCAVTAVGRSRSLLTTLHASPEKAVSQLYPMADR